MAALRYRDEHNKVGYLQKPKGSDDYHQVLDFLSASHIRSPELGPLAILATIDETSYTITEDSVRSQLQLADNGGIDDLPIAEIYSGMDNLGQQTPPVSPPSPPRSTQVPPAGHTSRGAEDLVTLTAVSSVVSTLVQKVNSLETELKDTKKLFKDVVGKLVKKVKAMEIRSWRLYTLSNVHVLETVSGEVLYMFADVSYPLLVKLMERMLKHKLEIDKDVVGNDMTTAEQLIRFIKNQIAAA
ncbi:hypothetical protein Tco_0418575 [Tanacetum coccineum]